MRLTSDSFSLSLDTLFIRKKMNTLYKIAFDTNFVVYKKRNVDSIINVLDSINDSFILATHNLLNVEGSIRFLRIRHDAKEDYMHSEFKSLSYPVSDLIISFICAFIISFSLLQIYKDSLLSRQLAEIELYKNRAYNYCQSCAKVFSPILLHGKEKDGTTNLGFCEECYSNGEFTNSELTAEEVITKIENLNPKIKNLQEKVSKMVRWNKNPFVDNYKP